MKKSIVIAEDNPHMRFLLQEFLKEDYNVTAFDNGSQMLSWLQSGNLADVVIADINMPQMNGWEVLCNLKASAFFKDIPVVILSATEKSQERIRFLSNGAEDFLMKPFNPQELNLRISNIIKRYSHE